MDGRAFVLAQRKDVAREGHLVRIADWHGFHAIADGRRLEMRLASGFRHLSLLVLAPVAIHMFALSAEAADYYVDKRVSTSGNGSISAPFRTIQEALNGIRPGDVILIRGDAAGLSYSETPSFPVSGTASLPITIRAYTGEKVVLTGSSGSRLSFTKDYWIIDGLIIDQANIATDAIKINASHITIQNCEIMNGQREGISIERAADVTIQDCVIHDFVWISGGTRVDAHCIMIDTGLSSAINAIRIYRNVIRRCSGDGTQIFGVTGQAISTYAKNVEFVDNDFVEGNTTLGLTENALDFKAGDGVLVRGNRMTGFHNNKTIVVQKGCRNIRVEDNEISNGLSGIEMREEGGAAFIQQNNSVVGNLFHDMSSYCIKFDDAENVAIENNTLVNIGAEPFRFESTLLGTPSINVGVLKNNLVMNAANSPSGTSLLSGVDVGYNGWFQASAGGLSRTTDTVGSNPGFANPTAGDYHLLLGSPCIDAGFPVGLPFVGAAPDLGVYEFNPGGDATAPAAIRDLRAR